MICINCNKEFFSKRNKNQKTCSRSCNASYKNKNKIFDCPKCLKCGKETRRESRAKYCSVHCQRKSVCGEGNPMWKGGRYPHSQGYIYVRINGKLIMEHRYIMQKHIGRELLKSEVVHHKNNIKNDNRVENLELLTSQAEHIKKEGHLNGKKFKISITTVL